MHDKKVEVAIGESMRKEGRNRANHSKAGLQRMEMVWIYTAEWLQGWEVGVDSGNPVMQGDRSWFSLSFLK